MSGGPGRNVGTVSVCTCGSGGQDRRSTLSTQFSAPKERLSISSFRMTWDSLLSSRTLPFPSFPKRGSVSFYPVALPLQLLFWNRVLTQTEVVVGRGGKGDVTHTFLCVRVVSRCGRRVCEGGPETSGLRVSTPSRSMGGLNCFVSLLGRGSDVL